MKPLPLLMLRPPSKALVAESPNAHIQDFELSSMSEVAYIGSCHPSYAFCLLLATSKVLAS